MKGAFVPEHRTHAMKDATEGTNPGSAVKSSALYRYPYWQIFLRAVSTLANAMLTHVEAQRAAGTGVSADYVFGEFREIIAMVLIAGVLEDNKPRLRHMYGLDEFLDRPPVAAGPSTPPGTKLPTSASAWDEPAQRDAGGCHGGHRRRRGRKM